MAKQKNRKTPTSGDKLAQAYRNRAAMRRVYEASLFTHHGTDASTMQLRYWHPRDMDAWEGGYNNEDFD